MGSSSVSRVSNGDMLCICQHFERQEIFVFILKTKPKKSGWLLHISTFYLFISKQFVTCNL